MAKKKDQCNNAYKVPNDKADEIWRLSNEQLISKATIEYNNWTYTETEKKKTLE